MQVCGLVIRRKYSANKVAKIKGSPVVSEKNLKIINQVPTKDLEFSSVGELGHVITCPDDAEKVFLSEEIRENAKVNKLRAAGLP